MGLTSGGSDILKITMVFGLAMIAIGCGSSSGASGTAAGGAAAGSGAPVPVESLEAAVVSVFCKAASTCPGSDLSFSSEAVCEAFFASAAESEFGAIVEKIKAGKIKYDAAQAGLCLKEKVASCSMSSGKEPASCTAAMIGLVKIGAACEVRKECEPGSFCKQKASDCPGVCTKAPAIGEVCPDYNCADGATCDSASPAAKCVADKPAAEGEGCSSIECAPGLTCDYNLQAPLCKKKGAAGESCDGSDACVDGQFCSSGKEAKCTAKAKLGEACAQPGDFKSCVDGHVCGVIGKISDGKMQCVAIKKKGAACTSHQECAAIDLHCGGLDSTVANSAGTCSSLPKLGEACTPSGDTYPQFPACFPGSSCDPASKKCLGPAAKGEACDSESDRYCGKGLTCHMDDQGKGTCKENLKVQCD